MNRAVALDIRRQRCWGARSRRRLDQFNLVGRIWRGTLDDDIGVSRTVGRLVDDDKAFVSQTAAGQSTYRQAAVALDPKNCEHDELFDDSAGDLFDRRPLTPPFPTPPPLPHTVTRHPQ